MAEFDSRTEKNLKTLVPDAEQQARLFLRQVKAAGVSVKVINGTRTFAEQDALFAQGRTKPGPKVTKARGGFSNHNFGVAWDVGVFDGSAFIPESPLYDVCGKIGERMGLVWGGHFHSITDKPHFQCQTGKTFAELRGLVAGGKPVPVLPLPAQAGPPAVEVFLDGVLQDIPALLIDSHAFVGAKGFTDHLGGDLTSAGGDPLNVTINLHDVERQVVGEIIDGVGFVKFADLNIIFNFDFVFDSAKKRLDLTK